MHATRERGRQVFDSDSSESEFLEAGDHGEEKIVKPVEAGEPQNVIERRLSCTWRWSS